MARLNLLQESSEHVDTQRKADRLRVPMNPDLCLTLESPNDLQRILSREDIHVIGPFLTIANIVHKLT